MIRKLNCLLLFFISLPALSQEQGQPCYFLFKEKNQITQKVEIKINLAPIEVYRHQALRTNFSSFEEAQALVQKAEIKTSIEYKKRYKELERLPSNPNIIYKDQGWKGWKHFLGTNFLSFEEAQAVVQKAGVKTSIEYKKRYKELGLPSNPNITYQAEGWKGWNDFLGTERIRLVTGRITRTNFLNFEEARQIVQEAGIKTSIEYKKRYKELGLPSNPNITYQAEGWKGWKHFLGTNFLSFEEAQAVVQKAGVKTSIEYKKRYKELGLPSNPNITYQAEGWKGWNDFLGTERIRLVTGRITRTNFLNFEEARQIVQEAGIKTSIEYKKRYKELGLPSHPDLIYKAQGWSGWRDFLGTNFLSFEEAQAVVQKAGVKTNIEYQKRYKELGRLPSAPNATYKDQGWKGWNDFLGTERIRLVTGRITRTNFLNFEEARQIVQEAGIKTSIEYNKRYKELGFLPSSPHIIYKTQGWSGWRDFLGTGRIKRKNFLSLEEAQAVVQKAEIKTLREYQKRYKELGRLPSAPNATYKDQGWKGWNDFLGTERIRLVTGRITRTNFLNFEEARQIVQEAGIKTSIEYKKRYKELGQLPSSPHIIYKTQGWKGWGDFLGTGRIKGKNFLSFEEAKQIVQEAGIKTNIEYKKLNKELALPYHPDRIYKDEGWKGWDDFLGTGRIPRTNFLSLEEAQAIVQKAGIKTRLEYLKRYKELGLPSNPDVTYKAQWPGWREFLGTKFPSFEEAKQIAQEAGIKTSIEYKKRYKELGQLPSSPHIIYKAEGWKGWKHFLGTKSK